MAYRRWRFSRSSERRGQGVRHFKGGKGGRSQDLQPTPLGSSRSLGRGFSKKTGGRQGTRGTSGVNRSDSANRALNRFGDFTDSRLGSKQVLSRERSSLALSSTSNGAAKDFAITLMMTEVRRMSQQWKGYDWVLRHTKERENPFIASDQVVGMRGNSPTLEAIVQINDFWLFCPLSWNMSLLASSLPLDADLTAPHKLLHVVELQTLMKRQARRFVASPTQITRFTSS